VGQKQLYAFPSITFNSSHWRVNIVLSKDGIRTLANVIIVDPTRANLFSYLTQLKDLLPPMQLKPRERAIATNTSLINSSP
jgi:hypothetical protein